MDFLFKLLNIINKLMLKIMMYFLSLFPYGQEETIRRAIRRREEKKESEDIEYK